jgi:hypothetical protein
MGIDAEEWDSAPAHCEQSFCCHYSNCLLSQNTASLS